MGNLEITHLLRDAHTAGFQVELADDTGLLVKGPRNREDILSAIRAHKAEVIDALQNPSTAVQHYSARLAKGIEWLRTCQERLDQAETPAMVEAFARNLHRWADLDEELRRIVPAFRGCPVEGCDEDAPVRCLHCAGIK